MASILFQQRKDFFRMLFFQQAKNYIFIDCVAEHDPSYNEMANGLTFSKPGAKAKGRSLSDMILEVMDALWNEAKGKGI